MTAKPAGRRRSKSSDCARLPEESFTPTMFGISASPAGCRWPTADADEDRHAAGHDGDREIDDRLRLVVVERRALSRRPQRARHAQLQVVLEQPLVAREVHRPVAERGHDGQPDARDVVHAPLLSVVP